MGMVVQHNMTAMNANRNLGVTSGNLAKSTEKLSSGYKINRAGDNAAGLAISEKMRGQIRGLDQASTNAEDGISMIQTAEGALTETHSILQRMRELAVQAASDTNTDDDRTQIQNEIDQLTEEVDRIANTTEFNTKKLLDGSRTGAVTEKAGKANVDSTFANSNVSAEITTDGSSKAAFTDVIRVEITKDFTEGQSTKDTPKLSDSALKDIYTTLVSGGGAVTSDEFKQTMTAANNTQAGYKTTNNSVEEAITAALSAEKAELTSLKGSAATAEGAVNANEDVIATQLKNIENFDATIKGLSKNGTGILADGKTIDDVSKALTNYVNALVEDAKTTGTSGTAVAGGTSQAVIDAKKELDSLFNLNIATTETVDTGATTGNYKNVGDVVDFTGLKTADGVATTLTTTIQNVAISHSATAQIKGMAQAVSDALDVAALSIAGAKIETAQYNNDVEKQQKLVDTLSDTDLAKAIYEYEKEAAVTTTGWSTDAVEEQNAKVAELKAEVDKMNKADSVLTVTDLFGNSDSTKNFEIGAKVDADNKLTVTLKNASGDDTVITINNADKLKAGDVITITAEKMVESKQAATGKEAFRLQVGANAGQEVSLGINSMKASDLEIVQTKEGSEGKALDVTNQATASLAVNAFDMAIQKVSTERAKMGAMQNRLEHTIANLDTSSENLQSAESSLRDTDMAEEMTRYSKNNILQQAGQSMLAQANQSTQGVLSLLG